MAMVVICDNPGCGKEAEPHVRPADPFFGKERTAYPNGWLQVAIWGGQKMSNLCSPACVIEFMVELMKPENAKYLRPPVGETPGGKLTGETNADYIIRKMREMRS